MTHCKCVACGIRCQTEGSPADLSGALCPHCGSLLEPVAELASVVGFRRITLDHDAHLLDDRGAQLLYARAPAVPRLGADA